MTVQARRPRRLKLTQVIPKLAPPRLLIAEPAEPSFVMIEPKKGQNYYELRVIDAIEGDSPLFRVSIPMAGLLIEPVIRAGAAECNESTGHLIITEYRDNVPTFAAIYLVALLWGGGLAYLCRWSTDPTRAPISDASAIRDQARAALTAGAKEDAMKRTYGECIRDVPAHMRRGG